jgi:hypothetical protein
MPVPYRADAKRFGAHQLSYHHPEYVQRHQKIKFTNHHHSSLKFMRGIQKAPLAAGVVRKAGPGSDVFVE